MTRWDWVRALRVAGAVGFAAVSVAVFALSEGGPDPGTVQFVVLIGYAALAGGVLLGRPDLEVLGWLLLGTSLLISMAQAGAGFPSVMLAAVGVVAAADFQHSVAVVYPGRDEAVGESQGGARSRTLLGRGAAVGAAAGASLACSYLGVALAPPMTFPENPAAAVGVAAVAALGLVLLALWPGRWGSAD